MSKSSPAAIAAATWALNQDASERRRLISGHGMRRVDRELGGLIITDHTAADAWLICQYEAAQQ